MANWRYSSNIYLEGLRETTKEINESSRFPGQDNAVPSEYQAGLLTATFREQLQNLQVYWSVCVGRPIVRVIK
jgi:hypothetical protein